MSTSSDDLWAEFAAETEEHLDAIERLLSDRRVAESTHDEIGALFRYFHSLKGTFLAMGFTNVEALAHRCEDILSLVRDGRSVLDTDLAKVLLRAADRLKDMREEVIAARADARPATDILGDLERYCEPQSATETAPAPAASAPSTDTPLADDPEMLGIFSELMDQRLEIVALALSKVAHDRAAAAETAGELAHGAEMMGFAALSEELHAIAGLAVSPASDAQRDATIAHFSELRGQAQIIEEITGAPSGAAPLGNALKTQLAPDYAARLDGLAITLARFDNDATRSMALVDAAGAARAIAACLGLERSARLLVLIEERFRNIESLDTGRVSFIRELLRISIDALRPETEAAADIGADSGDALSRQWQATFRANADMPAASTQSRLRPEVLATLSDDQRGRLERAEAEGRHPYELLFDLESNPEIAGDVLAWLSSSVETITSRTVYRNGANCFEFLIFSEHDADWVQAQLTALDPEQACVRGIGDESHAPETLVTLEAAEASAAPVRAPLIRVQSETIDGLMAEVGEMRTALASLANIVQHGRVATAVRDAQRLGQLRETRDPELARHLDAMEADLHDLKALEHALEAAHRRIWAAGLQLRVVPVDGLLGRLARAARDLAQKLGRDVDVVIEGREVRIDKSMVDLLIDPLMHMVRNAVDHGVEPPDRRRALGKPPHAKLRIAASELSNRVDIVIADDGQGLDKSKILAKAIRLGLVAPEQAEHLTEQEITALIFRPGFSTADAVTEISGRGVGLDVVAAAVQRLGGTIDLETTLGAGTKFTLQLPVSAALLRALLVEVGGQIFALPERQVLAVLELPQDAFKEVGGKRIFAYRGADVPVQRLATALGFETPEALKSPALTHVAIVSSGARIFGLAVDRILRFQDLFLKELHPMLAAVPAIAGASVLGDGWPVLVLDAAGLADPVEEAQPFEAMSGS